MIENKPLEISGNSSVHEPEKEKNKLRRQSREKRHERTTKTAWASTAERWNKKRTSNEKSGKCRLQRYRLIEDHRKKQAVGGEANSSERKIPATSS